jgi:Fibronectin type III domain
VSFQIGAAPPAPTGLTARVEPTTVASKVTLAWTPPAVSEPILGYVIEAGSAPGLANLARVQIAGTLPTYAAFGVPPGTYYVRVRAVSAGGTGPPSNEVQLPVP